VNGSVQLGSMGDGVAVGVGVGEGLDVGEISTLGSNSQPAPKRRAIIKTKHNIKCFTLMSFIVILYHGDII